MAAKSKVDPSERKVVTGVARLSYANVWEPEETYDDEGNETDKYSASVLIPKEDTRTVKAIERAVRAAVRDGAERGIQVDEEDVSVLHDGDRKKGGDPAYKNCWYVNARSVVKPQVVDRKVQPILDREEVYSGVYARVSLTFYAYLHKGRRVTSRGIGCGLGNIQKISDGERLGAGSSAEEDFDEWQPGDAGNPSYDTGTSAGADPATGEIPGDEDWLN